MTRISERLEASSRCGGAVVLAAALAGCTSPPSVVPMMRSVELALRTEAQRIQDEAAATDQRYLQLARQSLIEAYRQDLQSQEAISAEWVESATGAYVAAREALQAEAWSRQQARQTRMANLELAADAQNKAMSLLQDQDAMWQDQVEADLWRLDSWGRRLFDD